MATPKELDHLRKLKALADRPGTEAEGRAARLMLEKRMKQFGATEAQLTAPSTWEQRSHTTQPNKKAPAKNNEWKHKMPEAMSGDLETRRQQARAEWQRQHDEMWAQQTRSRWNDSKYHRPSKPTVSTTELEENTVNQMGCMGVMVIAFLVFIMHFVASSDQTFLSAFFRADTCQRN